MQETDREQQADQTESLDDIPRVCTVEQWAKAMNVSRRTVYRMAADGEIETVRVRNTLRVLRDKSLKRMGIAGAL